MRTAVGAEMAELLEEVTSDGRIEVQEVQKVADWLIVNQGAGLPAIDHLVPVLHQIFSDGHVSAVEIELLQKEIEACMPPELRRGAKLARRQAVEAERAARRAEADAEKQRLAAIRPLGSFNFLVAGVSHDGRAALIERLRAEIDGYPVTLARMPDNPYDPNAVAIYSRSGHNLGYVPRGEAEWMSPILHEGVRYEAFVNKIIEARLPIPVISGRLYSADNPDQMGRSALIVAYERSEQFRTATPSPQEGGNDDQYKAWMIILGLGLLAVIVYAVQQ